MPTVEPQIPRKLLPLLKPKRFKVVIGGRGSAKSTTVADIVLMGAEKGRKIGCFREFQNSIEDSVHSLLDTEIGRLGLPGFNVQKTTIDSQANGKIRFRGLARNSSSMKSMEGFKTFWIEEAQTISEASLRLLIPTLRADDSEFYFTANPMSSADPFSVRFIKPFEKELRRNGYYEDDLHIIIVSNYFDNPFFPAVLEADRKFDKKNLPPAEYEHIWLGAYNDHVENSIIKSEWFDACIDSHIKLGFKPRGATVVSHDPADGGDAKGLVVRTGSVITRIEENEDDDANDGFDWACDIALEERADLFIWDGDGIGAPLRRQAAINFKGKALKWHMFRGGEIPDNPDDLYLATGVEDGHENARTNRHTFKNKRAQYYWRLRDRMYNTYRAVSKNEYLDPDTLISISSDIALIPQLRSEVCRIPRIPNGNGLIQLMQKPVMKSKLQLPSPNLGDSAAMSTIEPDLIEEHIDEDYQVDPYANYESEQSSTRWMT